VKAKCDSILSRPMIIICFIIILNKSSCLVKVGSDATTKPCGLQLVGRNPTNLKTNNIRPILNYLISLPKGSFKII